MMDLLLPYMAETEGVIVRVGVSYLPEQSAPENGRWFWTYHIRIENRRSDKVQLLRRVWLITDARGRVYHVDGKGVIGEQPVIAPGGAYGYVSGCPLPTSSGAMVGHYGMKNDTSLFDVAIPRFELPAPTLFH